MSLGTGELDAGGDWYDADNYLSRYLVNGDPERRSNILMLISGFDPALRRCVEKRLTHHELPEAKRADLVALLLGV